MGLLTPDIGLLFWMTLSFGILFFILWRFGWPVIIKMMDSREEKIKKSLEEADLARQEMKQLQAGNEKLLIEAQRERDLMLQQTKELRDKMIEEAKENAQKEAQRILVAARESIEYEKLHAMTELKNQIANLSIEIAEDLLKHELTDKVKSNEIISKRMSEINLK